MVSLTGDGMGSGWGFLSYPCGKGSCHLCFTCFRSTSQSFRSVSTVWTVSSTASAGGTGGWRSPASQMQRNRDIALLDPAQPQEGGGSPSGEKAALGLPGDCYSAYGLSPERDRKPYMRTVEKWPSPPRRAEATPAGPPGQTGATTTSCLPADRQCHRCPRRWKTPGQDLTWPSQGAVIP